MAAIVFAPLGTASLCIQDERVPSFSRRPARKGWYWFPRTAGLFVVASLLVGVLLAENARRGAGRKKINALTTALVLEKTLVKVIAEAEKSVVSIARIRNDHPVRGGRRRPGNFFGRPEAELDDPTSPDFIPNDFGSGVIFAPDAEADGPVILTNYHVVKGGPVAGKPDAKSDSRLYVRLHNRRGFYASIVAADPRSDLAVLRIDLKRLKLKPADVRPMKLGTRDAYRKGQLVVALGNPYAQGRDGWPARVGE